MMARLERYSGQPLGVAPHIVVLGSCKVGNFVVSTPVLRGLKTRFPDAVLGFVGSELTADFEQALPTIDWRLSWDDPAAGAGARLQQQLSDRIQAHGPVQLAVNLDGFNPVTCTLVPWLEPAYVAGGSLSPNLRRSLPWGELPQQRFLADRIGIAPPFLSATPACLPATTSLNCSASWRLWLMPWIPPRLSCPWRIPRLRCPIC